MECRDDVEVVVNGRSYEWMRAEAGARSPRGDRSPWQPLVTSPPARANGILAGPAAMHRPAREGRLQPSTQP